MGRILTVSVSRLFFCNLCENWNLKSMQWCQLDLNEVLSKDDLDPRTEVRGQACVATAVAR
jgi:hypothetical protein